MHVMQERGCPVWEESRAGFAPGCSCSWGPQEGTSVTPSLSDSSLTLSALQSFSNSVAPAPALLGKGPVRSEVGLLSLGGSAPVRLTVKDTGVWAGPLCPQGLHLSKY